MKEDELENITKERARTQYEAKPRAVNELPSAC